MGPVVELIRDEVPIRVERAPLVTYNSTSLCEALDPGFGITG